MLTATSSGIPGLPCDPGLLLTFSARVFHFSTLSPLPATLGVGLADPFCGLPEDCKPAIPPVRRANGGSWNTVVPEGAVADRGHFPANGGDVAPIA